MESLKVLMVGGRRCGKTSALASMFDQMINGPIHNVLTMADETVRETKVNLDGDTELQDTLVDKTIELTNRLENPTTGTFIIDNNPTRCSWAYKMKLKIPGTSREMYMEFLDCPGEFFEQGHHDEETRQFVKESDVYVVMVDTPYLMECSSTICKGVNRIGDIHNFLTHINCKDKKTAKMVVFVPIKCEKWANEGKIHLVTEKVKDAYKTLIDALLAYENMTVQILPIQTAGGIEFVEMLPAYGLSSPGSMSQHKCAKLSEKLIRLESGELRRLKDSDIVQPALDAVIAGNVSKPYAWYHVQSHSTITGNTSLYKPYNCEQLPIHILSFMFEKAKDEASGGFWGWLKSIFGTINKTDMDKCMSQLNKLGLIKCNVDGIEYLKKCKF